MTRRSRWLGPRSFIQPAVAILVIAAIAGRLLDLDAPAAAVDVWTGRQIAAWEEQLR